MERNDHTITINKISDEAKASLKTRVITAIVGISIIIPGIFIGDWVFLAEMGIFLLIASYEIVHCAKKKYSIWLYICTGLCCLLICFWPILRKVITNGGFLNTGHIYSYFDSMYVSVLLIVVSIFALFYIIMWDENFTVRDACFIFTIALLTAIGFQSMSFIRYLPQQLVGETSGGFYNVHNTIETMLPFVYFLIAVFFTDIGAYFTGMLFGKKKINPRISPKKTWAGFFGGLVISTAFSAAFALILAANGYPLLPVVNGFSIFDMNHWYNIIILSAIIPPFATLGDFVFSAIKRYYGIKDFGNIMPGHGGILDRCDSIIFGAAVMAIFIVIVQAICYGGTNPLL